MLVRRCWRSVAVVLPTALSTTLVLSACSTTAPLPSTEQASAGRDANRLFIVDCLLPGQMRRLGRNMSFITPRRPVKVSVSECEIRGGEYVAYDRANFATSLKIWLPKAESGDPEAQTYVGEIFEKGLGQTADARVAAAWYAKAAEQGYSRALINLGYLYESGLGVDLDLTKAMNLYRQAAGYTDGTLEYLTSIEIVSRKQQAAQLPRLHVELGHANASLLREKQAFNALQADFQELEQRTVAIRRKLVAAGSQAPVEEIDSDDARQEVGRLLTDMGQLESELDTSQSSGAHLLAELEVQQRKTADLRSQLNASSSEFSQAKSELEKQESQIGKLEKQLASQQVSQQVGSRQVEQKLQQQLSQSVARRDQLSTEVERLSTGLSAQTIKMASQLNVAEARERSLTIDLDKARQSVSIMQLSLQTKDASYRQKLAAMNLAQDGLQGRIVQQQVAISGLEKRLAQEQRLAEEKNTNEAAVNSSHSAVQAELAAARNQLLQIAEEKSEGDHASIEELARLEGVMEAQQDMVANQREKIGLLERQVSNAGAAQRGPAIEQVSASLTTAGPTIEIIDPPLSFNQGVFGLPVSSATNTVDVIGRVSSSDKLLSFRINGGDQSVNEHGVFQHPASLDKSSSLKLTAVDVAGERVAMEIMLSRSENEAKGRIDGHALAIDVSQVDFGSYHALIIGNSEYQKMQSVQTAANDATALARVLEERFEFSTELLIDADRYDILAALNRKRDELGRHDNLVVYFAGHGEFGDGKGYWLPIDADPNDKNTWISNIAVTGLVDSMSAKHVMLLADSVFAGTLSRASLIRVAASMAPNERLQAYELASNAKARTVLSAGSNDPMPNVKNSGHSLFTGAVLDGLRNIRGRVIMAHDLFVEIRTQLASVVADQTKLQYAPLKFAGHENGEFMFVSADNRSSTNRYHEEQALPILCDISNQSLRLYTEDCYVSN